MPMYEFYYRHIAPIICRIVGHKWDGVSGSFCGEVNYGIRRFNYGRKGGKRRPQRYRKRRKEYVYCTRCGKLLTKTYRRKSRNKMLNYGRKIIRRICFNSHA